MTPNSLVSDSLIISGIKDSQFYRLAAGRAEFLSLCLVVFLMPLIPVPFSALLILATGLIFLLKGRLSLRRIAGLPLFKQVLVFWCVMLLYSVFSVVPLQSLQVTALYGIFILFYFMCRIEIGDGRRLHILAAVFLASVAVQSLIGLYQNFVSVPLVDPSWVDVKEFPEIMVRVFGTLDNPNILAQYLVPGIVLGTGLFLQERRPGPRLLSLAAAGLAAYCLYFTWSRGGILALGAALALFLALYNRRLFLVAVFLGILAVACKPALLTNRLASITNLQDTSIAYRFIIWSIAFNIIRDFWFSGVGVGTAAFRYVYDRFYTIYGVTAMHTHDFFIELLVEIGVFGFLIFLWLLFGYFGHGLRSVFRMENGPAKTTAIASLAGMAGYLVQGITEQPWYNFKMVFLFWFLIALTSAAAGVKGEQRQGDGSPVCIGKGKTKEPSPCLDVLHVISDTNIGGAGRHLLNFLKYYDRSLLRVRVACPAGSMLAPRCRELGVEVSELAEMPADESLDWKSLRRQIPALLRVIRGARIRVVHTHASFAGRLAARLAGTGCVVYTKHTLDPVPEGRGLKKRLAGLVNRATCDRVIAVSRAVRENLIRQGIPPDRIEVIYNGVDLEVFRPTGAVRREWPGKYLVGVVARLSPEKGHRYFLEAAKMVAAGIDGVTFLIVGTGPLEQELKDYCRKLGIDGRVVFTGLRDDIPRLLEQLDVLVQPSLSEAHPLSLVEGMCMGRPCVATGVGGVGEVIVDGENGLLVEPANPAALADGILLLLKNPDLAARLGEAAVRTAARFDARIMAKKVTDLYIRCYNRG